MGGRKAAEVTSPLGIWLERLRNGERLGRMAVRLGISESYLHFIRSGSKPAPDDFEDRLAKAYGLSDDEIENISRAADLSRDTFRIKPNDESGKSAAGLLSRHWQALSERDHAALRAVVEAALRRRASDHASPDQQRTED